MELVSLAKEVFQSVAEHAASYRMGQTALRHLDRMLWVVEKCARWAVPPPLDQDERPQPELVRPLPWVFFLVLLITLRVTRESISLLNLVMGKAPLRSADVVMYIQSKRRYLRTLKYQGNRMMRARTSSAQPRESWCNSINSLFEFTMCFRRHTDHYGNNNTTRISNNDEVLVVKRSKRGQEHSNPPASSETTMERLIEKMMVDLDADTDEDSSFTLTNVTSPKSDRSDFTTESDQDTVYHNNIPNKLIENETCLAESPISLNMSTAPCSTPEKIDTQPRDTPNDQAFSPEDSQKNAHEAPSRIPRTPSNEQKIANGRTVKSVPSKKKGSPISDKDRRNSDMHARKNSSGNNTM